MSEDSLHEEYCGFFEGTEKLFEIWFTRSDGVDAPDCDLRIIPRNKWEALLKLVRCSIISYKKNMFLDSYVLSESSMFVSKKRFILKTCGSTTLLFAVQPLIYLVKNLTGFDKVQDMFYSRKNFMRPELQDKIHQSFEQEALALDKMFDNGAAYCLGSINRDCWYLYTLVPEKSLHSDPDQTLEVIMQDLDPDKMRIFTKEMSSHGSDATKKSGIDKIFPDIVIDDFLFDPCGYSMNGITAKGYYITIHITPEPNCSYVSFESNVPQESCYDLVAKLLNMFDPGKFLITIFANQASIASAMQRELLKMNYEEYHRLDYHFCSFNSYDLTYLLFAKAPS